MPFLAHTWLKRLANGIFELHPTDTGIDHVNEEIQPVVEIQPYIDILRSVTSTSTVFTTPSDRDFYLTNINLTTNSDADVPGDGTISLVVTPKQGAAQTITLIAPQVATTATSGSDTTNTMNIIFPFRGVLLARSSAISATISTAGCAVIAGYQASDRSGE